MQQSTSSLYNKRRRRHRSTRLHSTQALKAQKPFANWKEGGEKDADKVNSRRVHHLCEEYNRYLPFAEGYAHETTLNVIKYGTAFEETVRDIERIVEEARLKVKHRCEDLEYHLDNMIVSAAKDPNSSCPKGNLLDLSRTEMNDFLRHFQIKDANVFSDYVLRTFQQSASGEMESYSSKERNAEADNFLPRCLRLVQQMIDVEKTDTVLHALVTLKSIHRRTNARLRSKNLSHAHEELDELIKGFVGGDVDEDYKIYSVRSSRSSDSPVQVREIDYGYLNWPFDGGGNRHSYKNYAHATRILRKVYLDKEEYEFACIYGFDGDDGSYPDSSDDFSDPYGCFHLKSANMLHWLQTKAWSEIRTSVMLTAGSKLPAELAERVFEFALQAEDIPQDPSVQETVMVEFPKHLYDRPHRKKPGPRRVVRTKTAYRCEAFDDEEDLDLWLVPEDDVDPYHDLVGLRDTFMDFTNE